MRRAEQCDASRLSDLAERSFRDTFSAANTQEDMDSHCRSHFSEEIQSREIADEHMITLLSERNGELAGFSQLRWGEAPPCVAGARPAEILRLYVAKKWHGRGVAQELMAESLSVMRERDVDQAWLGVWEHNPRAIAFYRKLGFSEVGEQVFQLGADPQRDLIMVRTVEPMHRGV